jgi:hypothetical protein
MSPFPQVYKMLLVSKILNLFFNVYLSIRVRSLTVLRKQILERRLETRNTHYGLILLFLRHLSKTLQSYSGAI